MNTDDEIRAFVKEIKQDLIDEEYKNFMNSEEMSRNIFELLQSEEIHCRLVAYPLSSYNENNLPEYENQLEEYPQIDIIYDYTEGKVEIVLLNDVEDFIIEIDENHILNIDSETKRDMLQYFKIENGYLIYDLGLAKGLHWSILIKYSTGWEDFDYTDMDIFYYPIYSQSKLEKNIVEEYNPSMS